MYERCIANGHGRRFHFGKDWATRDLLFDGQLHPHSTHQIHRRRNRSRGESDFIRANPLEAHKFIKFSPYATTIHEQHCEFTFTFGRYTLACRIWPFTLGRRWESRLLILGGYRSWWGSSY
ncbi:hypothetical protein PILCRDRAFT_636182 [Piloderma croceum F 1598]|uniref:Uncharacterized protein n=1 Tax=Piloderma croceum (strain F 1598) TaxID=765440 RepID=A0A0C3FAM4_PILCF|nr:hypothetical protein PILCRDRAFT_636182 [Piloderma croceum F 1598]